MKIQKPLKTSYLYDVQPIKIRMDMCTIFARGNNPITQPGKKHISAYISEVGNVPRLFALHFGHRGCRALEENTLVKREI